MLDGAFTENASGERIFTPRGLELNQESAEWGMKQYNVSIRSIPIRVRNAFQHL